MTNSRRNAIKCNHCGDVIDLADVRGYKECTCGRVRLQGAKEHCGRCGCCCKKGDNKSENQEKRN